MLERVAAAQSRVDQIKASTKDRREQALGQSFLEVAETQTKASAPQLYPIALVSEYGQNRFGI